MKKILLLMLGIALVGCKQSSVAPTPEGTKLTLNQTSFAVNVDGTSQLSVTAPEAFAADTNVRWTSLNKAVATVNAKTGVVTGVSSGTTVIYAYVEGKGSFRGSCAVLVGNNYPDKITVWAVKVGGDITKPEDAKWSVASGADTLQVVYKIEPATTTVQAVTLVRSDSVGTKLIKMSAPAPIKDKPGYGSFIVIGNMEGVLKVKLSLPKNNPAKCLLSDEFTITVTAPPVYTATKGKTEHQAAVISEVEVGVIDTLVIKGLPNNGVFSPLTWTTNDPASIEIQPFSYKTHKEGSKVTAKDSTVWGAQVLATYAPTAVVVYAMTGQQVLKWEITCNPSQVEKGYTVKFPTDSIAFQVGEVYPLSVIEPAVTPAGADVEYKIIPRPAQGTLAVNKKWWLPKGKVAGADIQDLSSQGLPYLYAPLGIVRQGEMLRVATVSNAAGKAVQSDTMKMTVISDAVMQDSFSGAWMWKVRPVMVTSGGQTTVTTMVANYGYSNPFGMDCSDMAIKSATLFTLEIKVDKDGKETKRTETKIETVTPASPIAFVPETLGRLKFTPTAITLAQAPILRVRTVVTVTASGQAIDYVIDEPVVAGDPSVPFFSK